MQEAVAAAAELLGVEIGGGDRAAARAARRSRSAPPGGLPDADPRSRSPRRAHPRPATRSQPERRSSSPTGSSEERFERSPILTAQGARSGLTVADRGAAGPFGVLGLHSPRAASTRRGDVDFAQALANVLGDAFERQVTEDDIRHRALHDPLTGLPNRVLFLDRLAAGARAPAPPRFADARSCSSTSTASSWSTTASATRSATSCWPPPRRGSSRRCAQRHGRPLRRRRVRRSCSRRSPASTTRSRWPSGSPACSRARSCSPATSTS